MHGIAQSAQRRLRLGNGEFQPVPGDAAMDLLSWSELLGEQNAGQFLVQLTPDSPAQRSRAVFRLIATIDYPVDGVIVEAQGDVLRSQPLPGWRLSSLCCWERSEHMLPCREHRRRRLLPVSGPRSHLWMLRFRRKATRPVPHRGPNRATRPALAATPYRQTRRWALL